MSFRESTSQTDANNARVESALPKPHQQKEIAHNKLPPYARIVGAGIGACKNGIALVVAANSILPEGMPRPKEIDPSLPTTLHDFWFDRKDTPSLTLQQILGDFSVTQASGLVIPGFARGMGFQLSLEADPTHRQIDSLTTKVRTTLKAAVEEETIEGARLAVSTSALTDPRTSALAFHTLNRAFLKTNGYERIGT